MWVSELKLTYFSICLVTFLCYISLSIHTFLISAPHLLTFVPFSSYHHYGGVYHLYFSFVLTLLLEVLWPSPLSWRNYFSASLLYIQSLSPLSSLPYIFYYQFIIPKDRQITSLTWHPLYNSKRGILVFFFLRLLKTVIFSISPGLLFSLTIY